MMFSPDEIVYNYGGLSGKVIRIDGVDYTIDYVKSEKWSRQLQAKMTNGDIIPLNQDGRYEFVGITEVAFSMPTKAKAKGRG